MLGDHITVLPSIGEIRETFTRDSWTVVFHALVVENLGADMYGGTPFLKLNDITPRQKTREIMVHNKFKVFSTDLQLPLPQQTLSSCSVLAMSTTSSKLQVIKLQPNQVILPGQDLVVPTHHTADGEIILAEARLENKNKIWPPTQSCTVSI